MKRLPSILIAVAMFGSVTLAHVVAAPAATSRTFVIPHILERAGRVTDHQFTFDTMLYASYTPGLAGSPQGGGAHLDLYLFADGTAKPMKSGTGTDVCNPCPADLSSTKRKESYRLDDFITRAGGFGSVGSKLGYGIVVVGGADPAGVSLEGSIINSHTSPTDVSVFNFAPQEIVSKGSARRTSRTFSFPHVLETSGRISDTQFTFDTTVFVTYTPGLAGTSAGDGAHVDLFLYDEPGAGIMKSGTGVDVCNPCQFTLDQNVRKQSVRVDDLIEKAGGFGGQRTKLGYAVIVVTGADPDGVMLQGFVVNSHSSASDLSMYGSTPQELVSRPQTPGAGPSRRTFSFPHVLETSGRVTQMPNTFDTTLYAAYTSGLGGTPAGAGAMVDVFLYESTDEPMTSRIGAEVCNPCSFTLDSNTRKVAISVDDLITKAGGFGPQGAKVGYAVLIVGGADPDGVSFEGFVVNSHTGPFDLSVFDSAPKESPARNLPSPPAQSKKAFVLPHVLEASGRITDTPYTFDTTITAVYAPVLEGLSQLAPRVPGFGVLPFAGGATVDLYLFGDDGASTMKSGAGRDVCNPCSLALDSTVRKVSIRLDDVIQAAGGFGSVPTRLGFGVLVVGGMDPDAVSLQGFVVNSHTSAFDLSVFGFDPQPIVAAP